MFEDLQPGTPPKLPCHDDEPLSAASPGPAPESPGSPATGADAAAGPQQQHAQPEAAPEDGDEDSGGKDKTCAGAKEQDRAGEAAAAAAAEEEKPASDPEDAASGPTAETGKEAGAEPAGAAARDDAVNTGDHKGLEDGDAVSSAPAPRTLLSLRGQEVHEVCTSSSACAAKIEEDDDDDDDDCEEEEEEGLATLAKFAQASSMDCESAASACAAADSLAAFAMSGGVDAGLLQADFYGAGFGGSADVFRGGVGGCEPAGRVTKSPRAPIQAVNDAGWPNLCSKAGPRGGVEGKAAAAGGVRGSKRRRQLDRAKMKEAMELAMASAEAEKSGLSEWVENVWEEALALEPLLSLAAHPEFVMPSHFYQGMDACMSCLLHAPQDHLLQAERMVKLLDSADAEPLLDYLDWLEAAVEEVHPSLGGTSCRTVVVPQRVSSALASWPAECALLQKSATALCEALLVHGPEHSRNHGEWRKAVDVRDGIQCQQEEECMQIARDLEEATAHFTSQLQDLSGDEWTHLARTSHASLSKIQQLTTELLQQQREVWSDALEEYEAMAQQATTCCAAVCEARRQVKRHEQAFRQAARRFTEVASQLVAWTRGLVPKVRLLIAHGDDLRSLVALRRRLPLIEKEHLAAEDELDMAQTELRKHKRHSSRATQSQARPSIDAAAGAILERQIELRVKHAEERVQTLSRELYEAEQKLQEAEAALPLVIDPDEEDEAGGASGQRQPREREHLTAEERLALKLATLEQFHEDAVMQVSQVQAERDQVLKQVAERKEQAAAKLQIELDFMCPIMHEKMTEPVLAADGHTYERAAIEKWLQLHNTSPMTGAPLAHRYLTENFALRHVIASYDARMKAKEEEAPEKVNASAGCAYGSPPQKPQKLGEPLLEDSQDEEEVWGED